MGSEKQDIGPWLRENAGRLLITQGMESYIEALSFEASHAFRPGGRLVDLGGGVSPVNAFLASRGMDVTVIDLMESYYVHSNVAGRTSGPLAFIESCGVKFIERDLTRCDLTELFEPESLDVVTTAHTLEHLHESPRDLLKGAMAALKPGGMLYIEVPNAVNLLKRAKVLMGRTNYLPYRQLYEPERYVGHIREYTTGDLRELAGRIGLADWRVTGRNWYGTLYSKFPAPLAKAADRMLRLRPGLCGSLFLIGQKPA